MTPDFEQAARVGAALRGEALPDGMFKELAELLELFGFESLDQQAAETIADTLARSSLRSWPMITAKLNPATRVRLIPTAQSEIEVEHPDRPRADRMGQESPRGPDERAPRDVRTARANPIWRRGLKAVVVVLFVLLGGLAASTRPKNGAFYTSVAEAVRSWVEGALAAIVWLIVIGSIGHLIARNRGKVRRWGESVLTFPILLVSLLLVVLAAGGRLAQHQAALDKATANPSGTLIQREKANLDAQDWNRTRAPVEIAVNATVHRHSIFLNLFTRDGNTLAVRQMASSIKIDYVQEEARWRALPQTPLAGLQQADSEGISGVALAASAYANYVAGLKANTASRLPLRGDSAALALLDRGDAKFGRAVKALRAFQKELVMLDSEYSMR